MASLEKELKAAIFDLLKNNTDVSNIVGTKIFDTRVPPGPSPPWVRYYIVAETALNDFVERSPTPRRLPSMSLMRWTERLERLRTSVGRLSALRRGRSMMTRPLSGSCQGIT